MWKYHNDVKNYILFGTDACAFDSFLIVPYSDSCLIVRGGEEKRK